MYKHKNTTSRYQRNIKYKKIATKQVSKHSDCWLKKFWGTGEHTWLACCSSTKNAGFHFIWTAKVIYGISQICVKYI